MTSFPGNLVTQISSIFSVLHCISIASRTFVLVRSVTENTAIAIASFSNVLQYGAILSARYAEIKPSIVA